jgi:hypothetical protein
VTLASISYQNFFRSYPVRPRRAPLARRPGRRAAVQRTTTGCSHLACSPTWCLRAGRAVRECWISRPLRQPARRPSPARARLRHAARYGPPRRSGARARRRGRAAQARGARARAEAGRHDRHGVDRVAGVQHHLQAGGLARANQPAHAARGQPRRRVRQGGRCGARAGRAAAPAHTRPTRQLGGPGAAAGAGVAASCLAPHI